MRGTRSRLTVAVGATAALAALATPAIATPADAELVSQSTSGERADGDAAWASVSADGRLVAFTSKATNLGDPEGGQYDDIYVRDLATGETELISRGTDGEPGNGGSRGGFISGDGRFVAFNSWANSMSTVDNDNAANVFVHDLATGETVLVSRASGPDGEPGNGGAYVEGISHDGRYVVFNSTGHTESPDDRHDTRDTYVWDLVTHETELISRESGPSGRAANGDSLDAAISVDGRYVAFASRATNLSADDRNAVSDIFVRDRLTHRTSLVSRATGTQGVAADRDARFPSISGDGRLVAFESMATNLAPESTWSIRRDQVYLRDLAADQTALVSRGVGPGGRTMYESGAAAISSDGSRVVFTRAIRNYPPTIPRHRYELVMSDVATGALTPLPPAEDDHGATGVRLSADGTAVVFTSLAGAWRPERPITQSVFRRELPVARPLASHTPVRCAGRPATIVGSDGPDRIAGTSSRDVIVAHAGSDIVLGRGGNDLICLGGGHDRADAGPGNDRIVGGSGNDRIGGGAGRDRLSGNSGRDRLIGHRGRDLLLGGSGRDITIGGRDKDTCRAERTVSC